MNKYILVDGNNIFHRANAIFVKNKLDDPLVNDGGYPTGLVYGVFSMLGDWISSINHPTSMKFFIDGIPTRRRILDPEYKAQRDSVRLETEYYPMMLSDGFEAKNPIHIIIHLLNLLGADIYYGAEEEADDLIASFIRSHPNDIHVIISSDTDFYQLLTKPNVVIYRPGIKGNRFFDAERAEEHLFEKFKVRVPPANVRMFKSLTGDNSDFIVGVPRLRKKVAAPLCSSKSVDELYTSGFLGFSKKEKERILVLRERIELNWELIGLIDTIDIESLCTISKPDFVLANRIFQSDLGISTVLAYLFQFDDSRIRLSDPVKPNYPWLGDI